MKVVVLFSKIGAGGQLLTQNGKFFYNITVFSVVSVVSIALLLLSQFFISPLMTDCEN